MLLHHSLGPGHCLGLAALLVLIAGHGVHGAQFVPGQLASAFVVSSAIPNGTFTFAMGDRPAAPVLIFALNTTDPFTSFMWRSNASIDKWLAQGPATTEYVFLTYEAPDASSATNALRTAIIAGMDRAGMGLAEKEARLGLMHFANSSLAADQNQAFLADLLGDWESPLNLLQMQLQAGQISPPAVPRMDGHYGWCAWPQPGDTGPIVVVQDPCSGAAFEAANNSYALVFYENITAPGSLCDLESALDVAQAANAVGVVFVATQGAYLEEIGGDGDIDAVNLAITMVDRDTGLAIAAACSNASVQIAFQTASQAGFFAAIDTEGLIQEVGWEKYPAMMMLGWEAQWLEFVTELHANLSKPALVIPVMDNLQMVGAPGAVANISMTQVVFESLRGYGSFELDMALTCPGNMDTDCALWDQTVELYVCCASSSETQAPSSDPLCNQELGRWITPFRRRIGRWLTPVTQLLPLLTSPQCTFTMQTPPWATAWVVSLNLRFTDPLPVEPVAGTGPPSGLIPLFQGATFDQNYNNRTPVIVTVDKAVRRVELEAVITGHGSDNNNCGEFCPTSHHFLINGVEFMVNFTEAGTPFGCADKVRQGAEPNEHGTWYYGRNGWCDGQDVRPWVVDVTEHIRFGSTNNITYFGWYGNGTPNPTESPGVIIMYSNLVLYPN